MLTPEKEIENWAVYMILASDMSYYTGITTDVERRFLQHGSGSGGAKYFNGRAPVRVVYEEHGHTRSSASQREAAIKKLSRAAKEKMLSAEIEAGSGKTVPGIQS